MDTIMSLVGEVLLAFGRLAFPWRAKARYIVMLGGPGAGKGTMTDLLVPRTQLPKFGMGAVVREYIKTAAGKKWAPLVEGGGLLPGRIVIWRTFLELRKSKYNRGAILDGMPRTKAQARWLRLILAFWGHRVSDAIFLEVPEKDTVERLALRRSCPNTACALSYHLKFNPPKRDGFCDNCASELVRRADDSEDAVKERLRLYRRTSGPLVSYFDSLGVLHRITSTNEMSVPQVLETVYFTLEESD